MSSRLTLVRRYFSLLEQFATDQASLSSVLHPDIKQREFPNTLNKNGQESDFNDFLRRSEMGKKILQKQTYNITNVVEQENKMVVEAEWRGTMAIDAGALKKDQELKAFFCIALEFKDDKIFRQRNYDCFEPF